MKRYFQDEDPGALIGAAILLAWIVGSIWFWWAVPDEVSVTQFLVGGLFAGLVLSGMIVGCFWILWGLGAGAWLLVRGGRLLVRVVGRVIADAWLLFHDGRPRS